MRSFRKIEPARIGAIAAIALMLTTGSGCAHRTASCTGPSPLSHYNAAHATNGRSDAGAVARYALASLPIESVACHASEGDRYAQFTLGHGYEHGLGLPRSLPRAVAMYGRAARASGGGDRPVYSAPVGAEAYGTVIRIPISAGRGLPEAQAALERIFYGIVNKPSPGNGELPSE